MDGDIGIEVEREDSRLRAPQEERYHQEMTHPTSMWGHFPGTWLKTRFCFNHEPISGKLSLTSSF